MNAARLKIVQETDAPIPYVRGVPKKGLIARKWTGKHHGKVDIEKGVYWEACYQLGYDELIVQRELLKFAEKEYLQKVKDDNRKAKHSRSNFFGKICRAALDFVKR